MLVGLRDVSIAIVDFLKQHSLLCLLRDDEALLQALVDDLLVPLDGLVCCFDFQVLEIDQQLVRRLSFHLRLPIKFLLKLVPDLHGISNDRPNVVHLAVRDRVKKMAGGETEIFHVRLQLSSY